jgi:hypothetical protein
MGRHESNLVTFTRLCEGLNRNKFNNLPDPSQKYTFAWLPVSQLVLDMRFQRDLSSKGVANIDRIANKFSWMYFTPVVVYPLSEDCLADSGIDNSQYQMFSVVDGRHRTTAAIMRREDKVPCIILNVTSHVEAAKAFCHINSSNVRLNACQLYKAKVASGEPEYLKAEEVMVEAGCRLLPYRLLSTRMRPGDCASP